MNHEQDPLDKKLRQFPRHQLSKDQQHEIHEKLMQCNVSRMDRRMKHKYQGKKIIAIFASLVTLSLLVLLGVSFLSDGGITNFNNQGHLRAANAPTKEGTHLSEKQYHETDNHMQNNTSDDHIVDKDTQNHKQDIEEPNDIKEVVQRISRELIDALNRRDMKTVAKYVDPNKGLLFAPYVYIRDDAVVLSKNKVKTMLNMDKIFIWGFFQGKGDPIKMTPEEYLDKILDISLYLKPSDVLVDDMQQRGNVLNNIKKIFPTSHTVEYYNDGSTTEFPGFEWSSVIFVFETDDMGHPKLVAIVHDMWAV